MKKHLTILLLSILTFNCSKNDFENTSLHLEFDKEIYQSNDSFELTIKVYPIKSKKTVRFYKNLGNIDILFLSKAKRPDFNKELNQRFIEGPGSNESDAEYIDTFTITKEMPFEKKLSGTISELENEIIIEIPELKLKNSIVKSVLVENPIILVKGNCRTIYEIEGQSFKPTEITVVLD